MICFVQWPWSWSCPYPWPCIFYFSSRWKRRCCLKRWPPGRRWLSERSSSCPTNLQRWPFQLHPYTKHTSKCDTYTPRVPNTQTLFDLLNLMTPCEPVWSLIVTTHLTKPRECQTLLAFFREFFLFLISDLFFVLCYWRSKGPVWRGEVRDKTWAHYSLSEESVLELNVLLRSASAVGEILCLCVHSLELVWGVCCGTPPAHTPSF